MTKMKDKQFKTINGERFGQERALYGSKGVCLDGCRFEGTEDGESALKQSEDVIAKNCYHDLRYPYWHVRRLVLDRCELTENCRAALWYADHVTATDCEMRGIKAFRECSDVGIARSHIVSPEFGWKCRVISLKDCRLTSEYAFLDSEDVTLENVEFDGKYSFQYVRGMNISGCRLDTKDAFWHSVDVTVKDSVLRGEYLGWYSENLTLIRCKLVGTQPLCYCRGLRLIDCETEGCDLAFEYSDVEADIKGGIDSVKNVRSGYVRAGSVGEVIKTADSVYGFGAKVFVKE